MHHQRLALALDHALRIPTQRQRSCGKRVYPDRIAADHALARIRALGAARHKDPVRSYACGSCDGWHLTSSPLRPLVRH